jgi:hybrid cluster-associated redox disulfide protein
MRFMEDPSMPDLGETVDRLSLNEIMRIWPRTIRVFIDWQLHCVGCPIADFHRLANAADEHGYDRAALRAAILHAIEDRPTLPAPPRSRRRSAAGGEDS